VIPVSYKKDGTVSASARLYTSESFDGIRDNAYGKMKEMGRGILDGRIETEPFRDGNDDACRYCPYRNACGLDLRIPGSRTKGGKKD
jgi:ATP-dependent helicase/nuclease subunit B